MNTSRKTAIIADGIAKYAAVMDLPGSAWVSDTPEGIAWFEWEMAYPQWVEFVKREQSELFDRINANPLCR